MTRVFGKTLDELAEIIARDEALAPLRGTRAYTRMELEARHELARARLTETRQEMKSIMADLARL